jgi:hypothetical protein
MPEIDVHAAAAGSPVCLDVKALKERQRGEVEVCRDHSGERAGDLRPALRLELPLPLLNQRAPRQARLILLPLDCGRLMLVERNDGPASVKHVPN